MYYYVNILDNVYSFSAVQLIYILRCTSVNLGVQVKYGKQMLLMPNPVATVFVGRISYRQCINNKKFIESLFFFSIKVLSLSFNLYEIFHRMLTIKHLLFYKLLVEILYMEV